MGIKITEPRALRLRWKERLQAFTIALLVTLSALPASASIDLPNDPLTTGARVPPNILFILDDSGSMAFDAMPSDNIVSNFRGRTYVHNTVYYDPFKNYQPWLDATGQPLSGGTSYNAVYGDFNLASGGTIDLSSEASCRTYNRNNNATSSEISSGTQVCGGTQTFYVPKNPASTDAAYLNAQANYYRYQILTDQSVVRAEWGNAIGGTRASVVVTPPSGAVGALQSSTHTLGTLAAGNELEIVITSTNTPAKTYSVRTPFNEQICGGLLIFNGATESCSIPSTLAGQYTVTVSGVLGSGRYTIAASRHVPDNRCSGSSGSPTWINCVNETPTSRSNSDERQNYATWFSYHRTRMKAAKAGASAAFNELGSDVRVGFRTIWGREGSKTNNWPTQSTPIPVDYNDGLFVDQGASDNRSKWYQRLHNAIGNSGTPLHGALHQAGQYFSSSESSGPYGPAATNSQLACRQNFAILTTDGYWNDTSASFPAGAVSRGNQDNTAGVSVLNPTTGLQQNTYTPSAPYRDDHSSTLADVAMYYWKNNLRADMPNVVPTSASNPAFWQHMVTFGISIGLKGKTGFESVDQVPANYTGWPDPISNSGPERIDDLLHAAVNSRGTFLSASNPDEFTSGLRAALATIVERTGSFANVASNSTSLDAGSRVFQASYVSGIWTGQLTASAVSVTGVATTPAWRASDGIPATNRRLFTARGAFPASMTEAQANALARTGAANVPVSAANNAAYIAGNTSLELRQPNGYLRNRNHVLGDIVSSSPAYDRQTETVYVGANDGMLHAFNAQNGRERFAFIPDGIDWTALGLLSRPDYAHRYFVDGPVVVSTPQQTPGSVLVATLGKGGKGLFALDVATPDTFNQSMVKWQRYSTFEGSGTSGTDTGNMGLIQGAPVIAKVRNGATGTRTVVIVGNGINSTNQRAVLLVYDLNSGQLVREIDTGAGSTSQSNGLSGPVGWDTNGDGVTDHVYAGDMLGNVWKFDLSGAATSTWSVANSGQPLFTATDDAGNRQPISGRLTVGLHPANFATWVFFGTGRFMTVGDVANRSVQSLYAIRDNGTATTRASLVHRETRLVGASSGRAVRAFEGNSPLPSTVTINGQQQETRGWYINLLEPPEQSAIGERIISEAQVIDRVLVAASIIPTADACQSDGRGYINALDAFTGTSLASGSFFDLDGDGNFDDEVIGPDGGKLPIGSVDIGVGMPTLPNLLRELAVAGGSTGGTGSVRTRDARSSGRVSWRESVAN